MSDDDDHLKYLLTAYLFEGLSAAGRQEVEAHLAGCAGCRDRLEALRGTLGEVEGALQERAKGYAFEERRRARVMAAAKAERNRILPRIDWARWTAWPGRMVVGKRHPGLRVALGGLAALVVLGVFFVPVLSRSHFRPSKELTPDEVHVVVDESRSMDLPEPESNDFWRNLAKSSPKGPERGDSATAVPVPSSRAGSPPSAAPARAEESKADLTGKWESAAAGEKPGRLPPNTSGALPRFHREKSLVKAEPAKPSASEEPAQAPVQSTLTAQAGRFVGELGAVDAPAKKPNSDSAPPPGYSTVFDPTQSSEKKPASVQESLQELEQRREILKPAKPVAPAESPAGTAGRPGGHAGPAPRTPAADSSKLAAAKTFAEAEDIYQRTGWDVGGVQEYNAESEKPGAEKFKVAEVLLKKQQVARFKEEQKTAGAPAEVAGKALDHMYAIKNSKRLGRPSVSDEARKQPPTDPGADVATDILVASDLRAKAELGDHFKPVSPDQPAILSTFGNPDARMFHSESRLDDAAGGGGIAGTALSEEVGSGTGGKDGLGRSGGWRDGKTVQAEEEKKSGDKMQGQGGGGRRPIVMRHGGAKAPEEAKKEESSGESRPGQVPVGGKAVSDLPSAQATSTYNYPPSASEKPEFKADVPSPGSTDEGTSLEGKLRNSEVRMDALNGKNLQRSDLARQELDEGKQEGEMVTIKVASTVLFGTSSTTSPGTDPAPEGGSSANSSGTVSGASSSSSSAGTGSTSSGGGASGTSTGGATYTEGLVSSSGGASGGGGDYGGPESPPVSSPPVASSTVSGASSSSSSTGTGSTSGGGSSGTGSSGGGGAYDHDLTNADDNDSFRIRRGELKFPVDISENRSPPEGKYEPVAKVDPIQAMEQLYVKGKSPKPDQQTREAYFKVRGKQVEDCLSQGRLVEAENLCSRMVAADPAHPEGKRLKERVGHALSSLRGAPDLAERQYRGYRHYRAQQPDLSFDQFASRILPVPPPRLTDEGLDEDEFLARYNTRPFVDAARDPLSTFALDVDTASYTLARAKLRAGQLPDPQSVRVEEFVNNFRTPYSVPGQEAFGVFAEAAPAPFAGEPGVELLKLGIQARPPRPEERKPAAITVAIDLSGSMAATSAVEGQPGRRAIGVGASRFALVRAALRELIGQLDAQDSLCLVTFGSEAEVHLPRTYARQKERMLEALETLSTGGGTNVEAGLKLAYRMADEGFEGGGINRVILCSDGVANVGARGPEEMLDRVKVYAARGIDLVSVGFGMGQYNDALMERLANQGNGSCHFVDSAQEAARVFREQLPAHLDVLARDAKIQVVFDPASVERYRLLGYENRKVADKDFRNDKIDAGEVGHGVLVNALYEIKRRPGAQGSIGKVFLRWKDAGYRHLPVVERNYPLNEGIFAARFEAAAPEFRFLACVAEFAELLRQSRWAQDGSYGQVRECLEALPVEFRRRAEWQEVRELVVRAQALTLQQWSCESGR